MRFAPPAVVLLALPTFSLAVSLSDFTPRASNLQSDCSSIYTGDIMGCSPSDWGSSGCSKNCWNALQALTPQIKKACSNQGITGMNIISSFLAGQGPQSLCPNARQLMGGGLSSGSSSESAAPKSTSHSSASSSSTIASTETSASSSTTLSGTATATSLTASASSAVGDIAVDTSSASSSASSASPTKAHHDNSGGGSPFDMSGNLMSAGVLSTVRSPVIVLLAAVALVLAW